MTWLFNYTPTTTVQSFGRWIKFILLVNFIFNNTNGIVVPNKKIIRIEDPSNRDYMDISKKSIIQKSFESSPIPHCISKFVDMYLNRQPRKITILITEIQDPDVVNVYLSILQRQRPTFVLGDNDVTLDFEAYNQNALEILVLLETPDNAENIPENLVEFGDDDCRYGILLTQEFHDYEYFLNVSRYLVETLWTKKIANAAILGIVGESVVVAKSSSFQAKKYLTPSEPELIEKCNSEKDYWLEATDIFSPMSMKESFIHIGYFHHEPYIIVKNTSDPRKKYSGMEVRILRIIGKLLNCSIYVEPIDSYNQTVEEAAKEWLESNRSIDLVVGGMIWDPNGDIDYTIPYDAVEVVWLVPVHSNISLKGLITPFSRKVWLAIIGVIVCAVLLRILLFRKTTLLDIVGLVIGIGLPVQPKLDSYRLQFISYTLFGFLLIQFYLAAMAGQFLAQTDVQIATMEDLVDSGLIYGGTETHHKLFEQAQKDDNNNNNNNNNRSHVVFDVLKYIAQNFVVFDVTEYNDLLNDLKEGRNTSIALAVTKNMSAMGSTFNHQVVHILEESLSSFPLSFALWKGLPYLDRIDDTLARLIQGGIINYLGAQASIEGRAPFDYDEEDNINLQLPDLAPGFLLLLLGLGLGTICLICELLFHHFIIWKNKKNIKIKVVNKWRIHQQQPKKESHVKRVTTNNNKSQLKMKNIPKKVVNVNKQRVVVKKIMRPNVEIGYYKDMY